MGEIRSRWKNTPRRKKGRKATGEDVEERARTRWVEDRCRDGRRRREGVSGEEGVKMREACGAGVRGSGREGQQRGREKDNGGSTTEEMSVGRQKGRAREDAWRIGRWGENIGSGSMEVESDGKKGAAYIEEGWFGGRTAW